MRWGEGFDTCENIRYCIAIMIIIGRNATDWNLSRRKLRDENHSSLLSLRALSAVLISTGIINNIYEQIEDRNVETMSDCFGPCGQRVGTTKDVDVIMTWCQVKGVTALSGTDRRVRCMQQKKRAMYIVIKIETAFANAHRKEFERDMMHHHTMTPGWSNKGRFQIGHRPRVVAIWIGSSIIIMRSTQIGLEHRRAWLSVKKNFF